MQAPQVSDPLLGSGLHGAHRSLQRPAAATFALFVIAALLSPLDSQAELPRREIVKATMPAVVMVLAADIVDGRLQPVSSGSGTILSADGSVLTNYHVINNAEQARLHDLFVLGRFRRADEEPEFVCAGHPNAAKMKPNLDLALIKCSLDLNGRTYVPSGWPTIPVGRSEDLIPGEEVLVIGYPDVGGSTIHVTSGKISGWSGETGGAGRAFIKTDAAITHGNSGGTAVSEIGELIGVPTAFRVTTEETGGSVATVGKVGLIRPIEHARDLVAVARKGWTPVEGDNAVAIADAASSQKLQPAAPAAGVWVYSRVVDAANGSPVRGAFVVVFKEHIDKDNLDLDALDEQALTYGQSNARGEVELMAPVPRGAAYMVAVVADGYHPMVEESVLVVTINTPERFDPWGEITLDRQ
jgi:S1-C subfamily serine protease